MTKVKKTRDCIAKFTSSTANGWEHEYMYGIKQEPNPKQLWYLAASIAVIMAAFLTLILI